MARRAGRPSHVPKVINKRDPLYIPYGDRDIYVGRPSRWGNPHRVGYCGVCRDIHDSRSAVAAFQRDLTPAMIRNIKKHLRGKNLVCWCAPGPCHADVLLEIANG